MTKVLMDQISYAKNYVYTNEDVQKKVEENLSHRSNPVHLAKQKVHDFCSR